jgi:uncharacterized protein (DUF169 family)
MIYDKLEYPVYFKGGLRGFRAKETIKNREMIMAIPYSAILDNKKAIEDP